MNFGVAVLNTFKGLRDKIDLLDRVVLEAERLGFDCILLTDHFMLPWSSESLETWTYLSYVAAKTSNLKFGSCVTPIAFRPPSLLAKIVSTLDLLSKGRVIVGVGSGWYQPEFEAYSQWDNASVRVEKTGEGVELMIKLWTEDKVNFKGKYYLVKDAVLEPKPIQKPYPPIWFGSNPKPGNRMLKLTAQLGDGWIPLGPRWASTYTTPEAYKEAVRKIQLEMKTLKRHNKMTYACLMGVSNDTENFIREIEEYKAAGMGYFVLGLPLIQGGKFAKEVLPPSIEQMSKFAKEVLPSF